MKISVNKEAFDTKSDRDSNTWRGTFTCHLPKNIRLTSFICATAAGLAEVNNIHQINMT